jgi:hypothetical protein
LTQGLLHDGMKVLEVTGPGGSADVDPIVTTENLGAPPPLLLLLLLLESVCSGVEGVAAQPGSHESAAAMELFFAN